MNLLHEGPGYIVLLKGKGSTVKVRVHAIAPKYTAADLIAFAWSPTCRAAMIEWYSRFPSRRLRRYTFSMSPQLAIGVLDGFSDDGLVGEVKIPPAKYLRSNSHVRPVGET
jgi:hypothetical protein